MLLSLCCSTDHQVAMMMNFFGAFRKEGFPTQFAEVRTAAVVDILEAGFILAFVMIAACAYLILAGFRGHARWFIFTRVTTSLFIGAVLMICNFGQDWEVGHIRSTTPYKAGQPHEIEAKIGLRLGLRSFNITLLRVDEKKSPLDTETIDYNERFWWTWDQGRLGFGPYAGQLQQDFRHAQLQGTPLPILFVADYFTVDGEGLRFGRYYRTAGWYTHIAMWSAFPCWLLANFFCLTVIRYGAFFMTLTGLLQLLACILWLAIRNPTPLVIPFEDATLKTVFGSNYWLTLFTGTVCVLIGLLMYFLELRFPDSIAFFFGIDPLSDYEEYHLTASELEDARQNGKYHELDSGTELNTVNSHNESQESRTQCVLKRRTTIRNVQKSLFRTPTPADDYDEQPLYLNVPTPRFRVPQTLDE